jgi:signal transduction histidine kinase/ActR/RegA family two-component response regulator
MDALKGNAPPGVGASAPDHIVQFYETDDYLASVVAGFLTGGLEAGQTTIAVATPVHRKAFLGRLRQKGFDLVRLRDTGRLVFLDARETLSTFMNGSDPDPERFRAHFEPMLGRLFGDPSTTARAYGEMVDLLWHDENVDAALKLEALWNDLVRAYPITVLCSYALAGFTRETHLGRFHDVCRAHPHGIPAEGYSQTVGEEARAREVSRLQVRARALEAEIAHREKLEQALRGALVELQRAETGRESLLAAETTARAEAETAKRVKDEFLAGLSHELRTPLNAILGWAHIARDPQTDESTIRRGLDVIERNASLQVHLIDELLDVSRIVTGKLQLTLNRVNLATVLAGAIDSVRPAATAKSISLGLEVDRSARFVQGDAARLHQVAWNLLANAIKFTPDRGRIDVRLERDGSQARIVIRDTGQGIGRDFKTHIFERFRQADASTTRQHGGIGLGLTIVKYLVEAHGGTVVAESPGEGLGATFTVTLPLRARGLEAVGDEDRAAPTPQAKAATLAGARLLVVDDEEDARELVKHMMERAGAAVETAASAGEAIRLLSSASFDLLLADLGMPGQDGYALIAATRSLPDPRVRRIPAIAVSAYVGHDDRAIVAGYDGYVEKPVDAARLEAAASRLLTSLSDDTP